MNQSNLRPAPRASDAMAEFGYFSQAAFALSLIAGLLLGISITRIQGPLPEAKAEPWQLRAEDRNHYMIAIALEHEHSGDMQQALGKLIALRPLQDPWDALAAGACELGSRGYLRSPSGIRALRSAVTLYTAQGRAGCAEQLLPAEAAETAEAVDEAPGHQPAQASDDPRPTLLPTKPPLQQTYLATPTRRPDAPGAEERSFGVLSVRSFCDLARPALIETHVVDYIGRGIPGQPIRVRWGNQEDLFFSGLKVERGDSYADFQMEEDVDYTIEMAGARDSSASSLSTGDCYTDNRRGLKSYRVTFVER
jgi:hypothetical protein